MEVIHLSVEAVWQQYWIIIWAKWAPALSPRACQLDFVLWCYLVLQLVDIRAATND